MLVDTNDKPVGYPAINGRRATLAALAAMGQDGAWWFQDTFDGWNSALAALNGMWVNVTSGTLGLAQVVPTAGDTTSRGILAVTLTDDPAAPKAGLRRRELNAIAADGYARTPETWVWARFRMTTAVPTAANDYYVSPVAIANQVAGVVQPTNGMGLTYDQTVGIQSWVWRAWRAGVPIDLDLNEPWDAAFHRVLAIHRGTDIEVFWDGVSKGFLTGPEIQPASTVHLTICQLEQLTAALGFNPQTEIDLVGWGSPGV